MSVIVPGWCSTDSAAVRASDMARPSTGSPLIAWLSSQSAQAEMSLSASPIPDRIWYAGLRATRSRSTTTAIGMCTPYDGELLPQTSVLTGDASPSWARLVATATIGMPCIVAAYLTVSMTFPPPMPITASYSRVRSCVASDIAESNVPASMVIRSAAGSIVADRVGERRTDARAVHDGDAAAGGDAAVGDHRVQAAERAGGDLDRERRQDRTG